MALIPSFFGNRRSNVFDPFSLDIFDPFHDFPFPGALSGGQSSGNEVTAIANARIDWKETPEAHVFKADMPGLKKEEVKVEVEDGRVLQISGERNQEQEEKNDKYHRVEQGRTQNFFSAGAGANSEPPCAQRRTMLKLR